MKGVQASLAIKIPQGIEIVIAGKIYHPVKIRRSFENVMDILFLRHIENSERPIQSCLEFLAPG